MQESVENTEKRLVQLRFHYDSKAGAGAAQRVLDKELARYIKIYEDEAERHNSEASAQKQPTEGLTAEASDQEQPTKGLTGNAARKLGLLRVDGLPLSIKVQALTRAIGNLPPPTTASPSQPAEKLPSQVKASTAPPKVKSALETYEALISEGAKSSRKAGQFYADHSDEISAEMAERASSHRKELQARAKRGLA